MSLAMIRLRLLECTGQCCICTSAPLPQVSKDYDFTNKKYICPQTSSAAAGSSGAAPGPAAAGAGAIPSTSGTQPLTVELDVTGEGGNEAHRQ